MRPLTYLFEFRSRFEEYLSSSGAELMSAGALRLLRGIATVVPRGAAAAATIDLFLT